MSTIFKLFIAVLCLIAVSSCFSSETSCHYFEFTERNLYSHQWKVDSFQISVFDSATQYGIDTSFVDDGIWEFMPADPYNCELYGKIRFSRANGQTVFLITNLAHQLTTEYIIV